MLNVVSSSLVALFQTRAAANPAATAVVCGNQSLSYLDLHARVVLIATELLRRGVRPDRPVGLYATRTVDMIAGMLGILAAGAAYVPLDPSLPLVRLEQIIRDARLDMVLNAAASSGWTTPQATVLPVLGIISRGGDPSLTPLPPIRPDQLAYVMYTSGSTGQPKGVMVEHRNVLALLHGFEHVAPRRERLVGSCVTPFSFDVSVWEIFSALCYGGTLHLLERPEGIARAIIERGITSAYIPPGLLADVADDLGAFTGDLALDRLLVGVEPIPQGTLQRFRDRLPDLRIINGYGPTETTVCATFYAFDHMRAPHHRTPIGTPVLGYHVALVDNRLRLVRRGAEGEILIGGAGVARGYLHDANLTAARFVPDPFVDDPNARAYRTGDLGRMQPDGSLEFVGRIDHQLQIRGFRVEPGEIEGALLRYPGVKAVVVTAHADPSGVKNLVAYLVWDRPRPTEVNRLRDFLADRLPGYMIPSLFISIPAIPTTPHGKTDYDALPAPDWSQRRVTAPPAPPRTPLEAELIDLWTEVLGVRGIGVQDNFFELGGHSLSAARLVTQIEQVFGQSIPLAAFFRIPTVEGLAAMLTQQTVDLSAAIEPIHPRPDGALIPLSYEQERLWFLAQLQPTNPAYNFSYALRLTGHLDIDALHASLSSIMRRHAVLRTTFAAIDGFPYQVITPDVTLDLPVLELPSLPPQVQLAELRREMMEEAQKPFDLARGPLLRATLFKLGRTSHVLLITLPYVVFDGWSTGILLSELGRYYDAYHREGATIPLNIEPPIQYADYAWWQHHDARLPAMRQQLAYWRQQLGQPPPRLSLPIDRQRPATRSYRGQTQSFMLSGTLLKRLQALAQQNGATLFMTLLAAFYALLYRYTGQEDMVIGSFVANRNRPELHGLIGFFLNTVALRMRLSGQMPFTALLDATRRVALDAYDHADIPFEWVLNHLAPPRKLDTGSLFEVAFNYVNMAYLTDEIEGLHIEELDFDSGLAIFDLSVELWEKRDGVVCRFQYNRDLFDSDTITRLIAHYWTLLESAVEQPDQPIGQLSILSETERQRLVGEWNATGADFPRHATVHALFEFQAALTPDAPALLDQDGALTYADLNRRANRIAYALLASGVEAETVVGVCLDGLPDRVAALLGVLKAGAVYLPLDPAHPAHRIAARLADAGAVAVITGQELAFDGPVLHPCSDAVQGAPGDNLAPAASADSLACLVYPPGADEKPPGVLVEHRALVNGITAAIEACDLRPADRVVSLAPPHAAASLGEMLPALVAGAALLPGADTTSPAAFWQSCQDATVLYLPPGFWHDLVAASRSATLPPGLRLVVIGGECADPQAVADWARLTRDRVRLVNTYGAAETAVTAAWGDVKLDVFRAVPLGRPIPNTQIYVLDGQMQPVPVGLPGEMYVGGVGLARGYHNRPDLTAARFVPNPFRPGERLFRTGDLARLRPDGSLEFVGCVEPAPALLQAGGLPDRAALPAAAPRNAVEDRLAALWGGVLGVPDVGIRDNFFDLGGHSLLAARLIAQVERDFGQLVSLAALFDNPTIEEMAAALAEHIWNAPWSSLVPIRPGGTHPPLFLAHSFGGDVVLYYNLLPHLDDALPVYGLRAQGLDGRTAPDRRIEEMAARYVSELRAIQPQGPYSLGGYEMGGLIAFEMARQLDQAGEQVALLAILDTLIIPDLSGLIDLPFVDKNLNRAQRALLILRRLVALPWPDKLPYLRAMVDTFITGENHDHPRPPAQRAVEEAMREALVHYDLQPYPGPVTLFLSRERETNYIVNPLPAWQRVARDGLTVHEVPGTHHAILLEPHVAVLGALLNASLGDAVESDEFEFNLFRCGV